MKTYRPLRGNQLANAKPFSRPLREPEIVLHLLVQPTFGCGVERDGQPNGHRGADARSPVQNGGHVLRLTPNESAGSVRAKFTEGIYVLHAFQKKSQKTADYVLLTVDRNLE